MLTKNVWLEERTKKDLEHTIVMIKQWLNEFAQINIVNVVRFYISRWWHKG